MKAAEAPERVRPRNAFGHEPAGRLDRSQPGAHAAPRAMDWLDYGRLVAALWVMLDHYCFAGVTPQINASITGYGALSSVSAYGMAGLYFFFTTSGLVITLTAQKHAAADFFVRRLVRIYPTFLFAMTLTALIGLWGPERFHVTFAQYLANLTLNPTAFGYRPVDAVYWTLTVEITFYFCVLVVILTGLMQRLQTVVTIWVLLQMVCARLPISVPMLSQSYYFIAVGAVLSLIYQRRNLWLNYALLAGLLLLCLRSGLHYTRQIHVDPLPLLAMIPAIFALFLIFRGRDVRLPLARRIGSMTYPLYLLHFHIGLCVIYWFGDRSNQWLLLSGVVLLMLLASFVVDDVIEFRMRPLWLRLARAAVAIPAGWGWVRRSRRIMAGGR
jgi:peptidoglycan/LPS O-acetylase OafA/YrhL